MNQIKLNSDAKELTLIRLKNVILRV